MSMLDTLRDHLPAGETGPTAYECPDCGRRFETDAPPERAACSACGNRDVEPRDA